MNVTRNDISMPIVKDVKAVQVTWKPTIEELTQILYHHLVQNGTVPEHAENMAGARIEDGHVVVNVTTPVEDIEIKPISQAPRSLAA